MDMDMDIIYDKTKTVRSQLRQSGLQAILDLPALTEVAVNSPYTVYFDRGDGWESKPLPALSFQVCLELATSLAVLSGLTQVLGEYLPVASVILPDGERGQIAVPPATESGKVSLTFRKPSTARFSLDDYASSGRFGQIKEVVKRTTQLTPSQVEMRERLEKGDIAEFFKVAVKSNKNILLVGGTGSGKTTVMKAMVDHYPLHKRIFTIEDVHELDLPNHPNHLHLFYKEGGLTPKKIIESCMRMKPDHVLLAELRGDEAWTYLEMLNTGHEGSITTIHANDCLSATARLAGLVKQSPIGQTLDIAHITNTINASIDVVAFFKHTHLVELKFTPEAKNALIT